MKIEAMPTTLKKRRTRARKLKKSTRKRQMKTVKKVIAAEKTTTQKTKKNAIGPKNKENKKMSRRLITLKNSFNKDLKLGLQKVLYSNFIKVRKPSKNKYRENQKSPSRRIQK